MRTIHLTSQDPLTSVGRALQLSHSCHMNLMLTHQTPQKTPSSTGRALRPSHSFHTKSMFTQAAPARVMPASTHTSLGPLHSRSPHTRSACSAWQLTPRLLRPVVLNQSAVRSRPQHSHMTKLQMHGNPKVSLMHRSRGQTSRSSHEGKP